ncbi:unnamed protein product [Protopolystoma xenopodis]|uniref:Uncharacterized protein n=1 Tax=Protopolystoma xenopodis TaxID=117903 RepID=A0A448WX74_9PLAT|nr:unnamed protein product [Protopolystoma xenopodis]
MFCGLAQIPPELSVDNASSQDSVPSSKLFGPLRIDFASSSYIRKAIPPRCTNLSDIRQIFTEKLVSTTYYFSS